LDIQGEHTLTIPHTKSGEDNSIGGGDMPPKQKSKNALWRRNSISGSNADTCRRSGTFTKQNFSQIGR